MEIILLILVAAVVVGQLARPRYRVWIIKTDGDPCRADAPPPAADPAATKDGDPITMSRDFIRTLDGATQAQMFRIIAKDHFRLIDDALKQRKPAKARALIDSLKKQFPDAKFEGLDIAEETIRKMEA